MASIREKVWKSKAANFARGLVNQVKRNDKTVMFHTGRCGSTVMANILRQHPDMHWGGEIFNPYFKQRINRPDLLERVIQESEQKTVTPHFGFDVKYLPVQHLHEVCINRSVPQFIEDLKKLGFNHFILLHRKNYLRRAISAHVAGSKSQWHSSSAVEGPTKVNLDPNKFHIGMTAMPLLEVFQMMDKSYQEVTEQLASEEMISITYEEDILANPMKAYEKISKFIGLSSHQPEVRLKRTNPFGYEEILTNFDQIREVLQGTEYAWMLED